MISVSSISKSYGNVKALKDISLTVKRVKFSASSDQTAPVKQPSYGF